jgi:hypothetical protein
MSFTTAAMTGASTRANLLRIHLCTITTTMAANDSMRKGAINNGTKQNKQQGEYAQMHP